MKRRRLCLSGKKLPFVIWLFQSSEMRTGFAAENSFGIKFQDMLPIKKHDACQHSHAWFHVLRLNGYDPRECGRGFGYGQTISQDQAHYF
jgi:hypothetical protein